MNVHTTFSIALLGWIAGVAIIPPPAHGDDGFDRYAIILSKKPFGVVKAPEPAPAPAPPPAASPALMQELRVCALTDWDGRGIKASVVENKTNKSYTLAVGETIDGLTLISANLENEEVLLQRGAETAVMKLAAGAGAKPAARPSTQGRQSVASSKKYEDRRKELADRRTQQKTRRPPSRAPKYTGEALKQHLQEYNMEAIRQGLPPLPVELTPSQDDQLVAEGVLPPSGSSFNSANDPLLLEAVEKELREQGGNLPPGF